MRASASPAPVSTMIVTIGQVIASIYLELGRPSEQVLPRPLVRTAIDDETEGMVQDDNLKGRNQRTLITEVTLSADGPGYVIDLPNVLDYEIVRLERGLNAGANRTQWEETRLVPFDSWEQHYSQQYLAGAVYGGQDGKQRVLLNTDEQEFAQSVWRLSYQVPLLVAAQEGDRPPIPSAFVPLLKDRAKLRLVHALYLDQSVDKAYREALREMAPVLAAHVAEGDRRYREYREMSREPTTAPLPRYDDFRRMPTRRYPRAYLPINQ